MSSVARPRGPLPARVYWVRRLLLLVVVGLLVVGVQRLLSLDGGADQESGAVAASTVGAPFELPTLALPSQSPDMVIKPQRRKAELAKPEGPCDPADVLVTPVVEAAHVGSPVQIILELTTTRSAACEFTVSGETVAVNVSMQTGARELLWSTQDCPAALTEATVVARRDVPGRAVVEWDGRQSDEHCSLLGDWVLPGDYLVEAVALGGTETGEHELTMEGAVRPTVTQTVTPTPTSTSGSSASAESSPTATSDGSRRTPSSASTSAAD